jgi:hypothetical protein
LPLYRIQKLFLRGLFLITPAPEVLDFYNSTERETEMARKKAPVEPSIEHGA